MPQRPIELVPVRSSKPTLAQRRVEDSIKQAEVAALGVAGHFNPTAQQYNALLKQTRRRSVVPKDELWGVLHQMHPDFVTNPPSLMSSTPVMDCGVSTALHLQQTQQRKQALRSFDRSRQTPSAAFAIEEVQKLVVGEGGKEGVPCGKDRFETTSHASQIRVLTSSAKASPHATTAVGRRLMPERAVTTITFGHSALELDFISQQAASIAEKANHLRPWTRDARTDGRDAAAGHVRYATRAATSLGHGLTPTFVAPPLVDLAAQYPQQSKRAATPTTHHLTRSPWDQEAVISRRDRELEFSRVRRLPRPSNQLKDESVVLCLR
jgi:hypothetical protein